MSEHNHTIEIIQQSPNIVEIQATEPNIIQFDKSEPRYSYDILNFDDAVINLISVKNIVSGDFISVINTSGIYTISVSNFPSGNFALVNHNHSSSDITNFNQAVSGLIPTLVSGTGIDISNSGNSIIISVAGNFELTGEQIDDRVNSLLTSGQYITLSYDDNNDKLTISATGLQPSGNYASFTHTHVVSDITNFNSGVSGLINGIYAPLNSPSFSGVPTVPTASSGTNTHQIASTSFVRNEISNLVNAAPSTLDTLNELATALGNDSNFATTIASGLANKAPLVHSHTIADVSGLQTVLDNKQPSGVYASGIHIHNSNDITDFSSSVSGLLPVKNISAGSGIGISSVSGDFTVSVTGSFGLTSEEVDDRVNSLLFAGTGISLDYNDNSNVLTINTSGLQPSGNYALVGHTHSSNDVIDFNSSVTDLIFSDDNFDHRHTIDQISTTALLLNFEGSAGETSTIDSSLCAKSIKFHENAQISSDQYIFGNTSLYLPPSGYLIVENTPAYGLSFYDFTVEFFFYPIDNNSGGIVLYPQEGQGWGVYVERNGSEWYMRFDVPGVTNVQTSISLNTSEWNHFAFCRKDSILTFFHNGAIASGNISFDYNLDDGSGPISIGFPFNNLGINGYIDSIRVLKGTSLYNDNFSIPNSQLEIVNNGIPISFIENFNEGVSGLLPSISGDGYIISSFDNNTYTISATGLQPSGDYSLVNHSHIIPDVSGLQSELDNKQPSGIYASGVHYHNSSDITDFNTSVSGLLPVKNISAGTGISITSNSGIYTINSTGSGIFADQTSSIVTTVFNKTGSIIPKMTAVYINGGQGDLPTISLAIATGDATSAGTYGLTYESISNMSSGKVIVFGALNGLNTDQFNPTSPHGDVNGQIVYLSPSVSGGLTLNKPSAPNHIVALGTIIRTHQNEGVIEVRVQNGFELEELHNVAISGVTSGQFLQYNGSGLWIPSSSGNFSTLLVNGTGVSLNGHSHSSSSITDFNSSVSGLLPVTNIVGGSNVSVSSSGSIYTVAVTGSLGLTTEEVDDRVSSLLVAGTGISLDYNDGSNTLTINTSGLQPSGNYSLSDHTHAQLHDRSHAITSSSDHTATAWRVFYSNNTGTITELALGSSGTVLTSSGASNAPTFATLPAGGTKTIIRFTPSDNQPPAANFATLDTRNSFLVLEFDASTQESANFIGVIPEGASLTNGLTVRIWWMGDTATSGNVRWGVSFEKVGTDNDADSFSSVTEANGTANGTSGIETVTSITATSIDSLVAGDRFRLRVARIAADAVNDTMLGDAQLVAVELQVA